MQIYLEFKHSFCEKTDFFLYLRSRIDEDLTRLAKNIRLKYVIPQKWK
jgi:hypothetical protein